MYEKVFELKKSDLKTSNANKHLTIKQDLKNKLEDEIIDETLKVEINEEQVIEEDTLKIPNLIESNFYFKQVCLDVYKIINHIFLTLRDTY